MRTSLLPALLAAALIGVPAAVRAQNNQPAPQPSPTPAAAATTEPAKKNAVAEEKAEHPRLEHALEALDAAIAYMEQAPHDFGGHKAAALAASHEAVKQLKLALAYRAKVEKADEKREKKEEKREEKGLKK